MPSLTDTLVRTSLGASSPDYVVNLKTVLSWERQSVLIKMFGQSDFKIPTLLSDEVPSGNGSTTK